MKGGRLQMFQILWFGWETFSILENWSPSRGDRFTRGGRNQKFHCISISIRLIILLLSMVLSSNFLFQNWVEKKYIRRFLRVNWFKFCSINNHLYGYQQLWKWQLLMCRFKIGFPLWGFFSNFPTSTPAFLYGTPPPPRFQCRLLLLLRTIDIDLIPWNLLVFAYPFLRNLHCIKGELNNIS